MHSIRIAKPSDVTNLTKLAERTFRDTFAVSTAVDDMNKHCQLTYQELIFADEIVNPDNEIYVAEVSGTLIAYAQIKWGEAPRCVSMETQGELHRLYVDKAFLSKGVAHDLMALCLGQLKQRFINVVWLSVWENNLRAITFYRKYGFKEVGSHIFPVGDDPQRDIIMVSSI